MKTNSRLTAHHIILLLNLLAASIFLCACTPTPRLPESASSALSHQWNSLPGGATRDLTVVKSWQGKIPPSTDPAVAQPKDIWCVETRVSSEQAASAEPETVIWFITKFSDDTAWEVAPLMTISSIWPYQACGVAP